MSHTHVLNADGERAREKNTRLAKEHSHRRCVSDRPFLRGSGRKTFVVYPADKSFAFAPCPREPYQLAQLRRRSLLASAVRTRACNRFFLRANCARIVYLCMPIFCDCHSLLITQPNKYSLVQGNPRTLVTPPIDTVCTALTLSIYLPLFYT